ncbi:MAG: endonuclease [Prevotella sp.]|nr:endonuclease [Prevotella sp.]
MKNIAVIILFTAGLCFSSSIHAQAPQGYYDLADQKKANALKTAMHNIIKNHIRLGYSESSTYFRTTDWHPGGYFWDMYSNIHRTSFSGMNREHNMPKSWWSANPESTIAYSDLHNLYPSDAAANGAKSNWGLGVVGNASYDNGVVKVGQNVYSSAYINTVFEPADEYKGDFARDYMYMVTCYEDYASDWRSTGTSSMLHNETYPVFQTWAMDMLLEWSRQDPVSQKEIDRNNAVFNLQQNRNPFIDFPDLPEFIWGNKKDMAFSVTNKAEDPVLITPTNDISIDFGEALQGTTVVKELPVRGHGLTGSMEVYLKGNASGYFSDNVSRISTAEINREGGYQLTVTYAPAMLGEHSAYLTFQEGGFEGSVRVNISGKCVSTLSIDGEFAPETGVYASDGYIRFKNIPEGTAVEIYTISGQRVMRFDLSGDELYFGRRGLFLVKAGTKVYKIML